MLGIIDTNLLYKFKSCIKTTRVNVCAFSWTVTQKSLQIWCVVTYRCNMLQAGTFIQPESCTTVSQTRNNEYILQMLPSTYHLCCGDFYQQQEGDRRIVGRSCHHGKTTFQVGWCEWVWVMTSPFLLSMSGAVMLRRSQASRHERLSSIVTMLTD